MKDYSFRPKGVCSTNINFSIEDGKLHNIAFTRGCSGNLKAIGKLLEGADAKKASELLRGNCCGANTTSCADQLAIAIEQALEGEAAEIAQ